MEEININHHLIERCKKGEAQAQFLLYKQYSRQMYNIAIRFLNNKMDAEDILQESFVTAFDKLDSLQDTGSFGSWLKRIVINNCISHIRKNSMRFEDLESHMVQEQGEEPEAELNLDPELVHEAIKELPRGGRTILILHALEGYKHREIAEMLSISESTSKSQYGRALDMLFINLKQKIYVGEA